MQVAVLLPFCQYPFRCVGDLDSLSISALLSLSDPLAAVVVDIALDLGRLFLGLVYFRF